MAINYKWQIKLEEILWIKERYLQSVYGHYWG